jgi:hypothetical protein
MRTTLTISDSLFTQAKRVAAESRRTLGQVVEDALREVFARHSAARSLPPYRATVFKGDGAQPGINLDDVSELIDLTEKRHGPP